MPGKLDGLRIANEIAAERGGKCLSEECAKMQTKLLWKCREGHIWNALLSNVKYANRWCPKCGQLNVAKKLKIDGLKIAHQIAREKNGKCLSTEYINNKTKMSWECKKGHQWYESLSNIKSYNIWCRRCLNDNKKMDRLEEAKQIAKKKNGKCLSKTCIRSDLSLLWQCKFGHEWKASLHNVRSHDTWCPECGKVTVGDKSRLKNGLELANQLAKEKGGLCLSAKYKSGYTKMLWKCSCGNIWKAKLNTIRSCWCPECGRLKAAKKANNSYMVVHWKTGQELICQGSWEKRTVEYLNKNKINFRWQPRSFKMPDGRKYFPDCYLYSTKKWIEIKGYFWDDAQEKWEWFQTIKSNSELWNKAKLKQMGIL